MKIIITDSTLHAPEMSLKEFTEKYDFTVKINKKISISGITIYEASIDNKALYDYGHGPTVTMAIESLCRNLSNTTVTTSKLFFFPQNHRIPVLYYEPEFEIT